MTAQYRIDLVLEAVFLDGELSRNGVRRIGTKIPEAGMDLGWRELGLAAGVVMPLWNIPLIFHIVKRKSSAHISTSWMFGVWACIMLMLPSALGSSDVVLKGFGIMNAVMFSSVVIAWFAYRDPR